MRAYEVRKGKVRRHADGCTTAVGGHVCVLGGEEGGGALQVLDQPALCSREFPSHGGRRRYSQGKAELSSMTKP